MSIFDVGLALMTGTEKTTFDLKYPALYTAADLASIDAENTYNRFIFVFLIALVIGAVLSLFAGFSSWIAICSAFVFVLTLVVSLVLAAKRYDKTWYETRALAESVKTMTWRYVMRSKPYDEENSRSRFISDLKIILENNSEVCQHFPEIDANVGQLTDTMNDIRNSSLQDRIKIYNTNRIDEQRNWYTSKAGLNKRLGTR